MWPGPEAIAIWVELVAERKNDISENMDASQIQGLAARVAAQQEISRADLAAWDASARAWLLSADEVQKFNLTQLRLIIKDSGLLVSSLGTTYKSVIDVWVTAMKTLQDLILGRPQRVSNGALLVGLSCWHIFPDLNVVGPLAHVKFNDQLVDNGGVVTLGLQSASPGDDHGVQWSLSLSHLRYYGNPVVVSTSIGSNGSRISMPDLHMIALGSLFERWGECITDPCAGARMLVVLKSSLGYTADKELETDLPEFYVLYSAAIRLINSSELERQRILCLLAYGRRRGQNFLVSPLKSVEPAFGLAKPDTLWAALDPANGVTLTTAQQIENLRNFANLCGLSSGDCIIRYRAAADTIAIAQYAYTTAIPLLKRPFKRDPEGELKNERTHHTWAPGSSPLRGLKFHNEVRQFRWINAPECFQLNSLSIAAEPQGLDDRMVQFCHLVGNVTGTSLFYVKSDRVTMNLVDITITNILEAFGPNLPNLRKTTGIVTSRSFIKDASLLYSHSTEVSGPVSLLKSLKCLAEASYMYRGLTGATVSISIVDHPIYKAPFFDSHSFDTQYSLAEKLACIAMFETGSHTVRSEQLKSVMAMSSGNSIYVANALLEDPLEANQYGPQGITRIVGNIDHPGVVMLAPPQAPLVRERDPGSWRVINHHKFDGKVESCFSGTSLHLSFTKYEVPLSVSIGAVDAEICMVETLISTHDQKQWVADLDIIASLRSTEFTRLQSPRCTHEGTNPRPSMENAAVQIGRASGKRLVSISSWEELLDPPGNLGITCIGVVRAFDSWHARLATMSVSVQRRLRTVILPTEPLCTICGADVYRHMANLAQILIF